MPEARPAVIILVVEDEVLQRLALIELVQEAGFEPLEAWDADRAIEILESRTDVRLVFTDIDMPGSMDGLKLAAAVRDRWPPIEIILTSAGLPPDLSQIPERAVFLPKPIRTDHALAAMRELAAEIS